MGNESRRGSDGTICPTLMDEVRPGDVWIDGAGHTINIDEVTESRVRGTMMEGGDSVGFYVRKSWTDNQVLTTKEAGLDRLVVRGEEQEYATIPTELATGVIKKLGIEKVAEEHGLITTFDEKHGAYTVTEATKYDWEKPRMSLVDPEALEELAKVLTFGASKYAPNNWRKGMDWSRIISSLLRHVNAFQRGEDTDPETELSHMAHAMCNCMFLVWYSKHRKEYDDRYVGDNTST